MKIMKICRIIEAVCLKELIVTLLFVYFPKAIDSIHRVKMEQTLQAYGLFKETVTALVMLYSNTKAKLHTLNRDTGFFDIVAGVLWGETLARNLFISGVENVLRTSINLMKENGFKLKRARNRQYPAVTISDTDYADDIVLLANTPAQTKYLLHSLEQTVGDISL